MRAEMTENLDLRIRGSAMSLAASVKGSLFSKPLAEIRLAVCPECGYSEIYVEDTAPIRAGINKTK